MLKDTIQFFCVLFLAVASCGAAESAGMPKEAQLINGVLVPVPGEIFRVLDGYHNSNWNTVLRRDLTTMSPSGSSARVALSLGLVLGEGFLAIAAEDGDELQGLGRSALKLSRALGVEKAMLRREKSILDCVDRGDWAAVRKEWSGVNMDLKAAMSEIKSDSFSQLVSMGGWLRGADALSGLVAQHYAASDAQVLRQPMMLGYFIEQEGKLDGKLKDDPIVDEMADGMAKLRPLIGGDPATAPSERDVQKIHKISLDLVNSLRRGSM